MCMGFGLFHVKGLGLWLGFAFMFRFRGWVHV